MWVEVEGVRWVEGVEWGEGEGGRTMESGGCGSNAYPRRGWCNGTTPRMWRIGSHPGPVSRVFCRRGRCTRGLGFVLHLPLVEVKVLSLGLGWGVVGLWPPPWPKKRHGSAGPPTERRYRSALGPFPRADVRQESGGRLRKGILWTFRFD